MAPPTNHADAPGIAVKRAPSPPPVHDSPTARVWPRARVPGRRSRPRAGRPSRTARHQSAGRAAHRPLSPWTQARRSRVRLRACRSRCGRAPPRRAGPSTGTNSASNTDHSRNVRVGRTPALVATRSASGCVVRATCHMPCSSQGGPGNTTISVSPYINVHPGAVPIGGSTVAPAGQHGLLATHAIEICVVDGQTAGDGPAALLDHRQGSRDRAATADPSPGPPPPSSNRRRSGRDRRWCRRVDAQIDKRPQPVADLTRRIAHDQDPLNRDAVRGERTCEIPRRCAHRPGRPGPHRR